ncbi:MAG: hypothetical protein Q9187_001402 [Circinaria calcarea]
MKIFAFGSNGSGQLGILTKDDTSSPEKCHIGGEETVDGVPLKIGAGGNHSLILFSSGNVYTAGSYSGSSTRTGESEMFLPIPDFYQPDALKTVTSRIKLCAATWSASLFVTTENLLYTCGSGEKGELGQGRFATQIDRPTLLPEFAKIVSSGTTVVDLASALHHAVLVLSNGEVYGWGNGRKGQLGEPAEIIWQPRRIEGLNFKVVRAVCGREFTYLVGDPNDGRHIVLGANKWDVKTKAPKYAPNWTDIGASWGSIFVLDKAGKIASWGRNDHGQLASLGLPAIKQMAVGSEHAVALSYDGDVMAWGWGEHGNCGLGIDKDGDVKHDWNIVFSSAANHQTSVEGIGAGCATSWMWMI